MRDHSYTCTQHVSGSTSSVARLRHQSRPVSLETKYNALETPESGVRRTKDWRLSLGRVCHLFSPPHRLDRSSRWPSLCCTLISLCCSLYGMLYALRYCSTTPQSFTTTRICSTPRSPPPPAQTVKARQVSAATTGALLLAYFNNGLLSFSSRWVQPNPHRSTEGIAQRHATTGPSASLSLTFTGREYAPPHSTRD